MAINTMYCGFPLGAAGGGAISSRLIPHHGWRSVLLTGAIAPLILTVLLALLLPESVKFLVQRGKDIAGFAASPAGSPAARWIASRAFPDRGESRVEKRQRVAAVFHARYPAP